MMTATKWTGGALAFALAVQPVSAEEERPRFGGPDSVEQVIEQDRTPRGGFLETEVLDPFKTWQTGLEEDLPKAKAWIVVPNPEGEGDVVSSSWIYVYNRGTAVHFDKGLLGFSKYVNGRPLPLFIPLDCPNDLSDSSFGSDSDASA